MTERRVQTPAEADVQCAEEAERDSSSGTPRCLPGVGWRAAPSRLLWLILVLAALAAALWSFDQGVSERLVAQRQNIEMLLGLPAAAAAFLIFPAILFCFKNWRRLLIGFVLPLALSGLAAEIINRLVGRARPDMHLGAHAFSCVQAFTQGQYRSFPSGHATTAMTLALLLGLYFPRARWVFYVCALFVGLSRIVLERHFASDVLAGYMVAAAAVYACVRLLGPTFYDRDLPSGPARLPNRPAA